MFDDLSGKKALIIGVGEMSEITAKHLVTAGVEVSVMNRTKHKAEAFAKKCNTKVVDFTQLATAVNEFEILFTATSASEPIITDAIIKSRDFDRYWFDLALPRDIHYNKGERIHLYVIDDLKLIVDENLSAREEASQVAHNIIGREIVTFFEGLQTQDIEPLIKEMYLRANVAAKEETARVMEAGYIPREYEAEAQKMCEQTLKRFLHKLTLNMREGLEDTQSKLLNGAIASMMKEKD